MKFVRQGSILLGGSGWVHNLFRKAGYSKNERFGVVGCVLGCKTGFEAFL